MHSKTLIRVAMTSSLAGIIGLFIMLQAADIPLHDITSLKSMDEGSIVRSEGIVKRMSNNTNMTFIGIEVVETMDVIVFDKGNLRLKQGDTVIVEGRLEDYQGETEIIADSIIKKST